jgi:signal transduction histidine kinase
MIRTIVDTQESERERFARDLHDSLGQQLSGIKFLLETLKKMNGAPDKKKEEILSLSIKSLTNAMTEVRNLCFNIMPRALENFGLTHAIAELCKKMERGGLLAFKVSIAKNFPALSKPLEIAIYRIVQEFINNSIKHGKAKKVIIVMRYRHGKLNIILRDDGVGFVQNDLSKFEGMGIRNVKSRVSSYNGEVKIESAIMKGTSYRITIPV